MSRNKSNEMHKIYCPDCGEEFTGAEALFDLSEIFSLEVTDDSLGGTQPIPVFFPASILKDWVIGKNNNEASYKGEWRTIQIDQESLFKAIGCEELCKTKKSGNDEPGKSDDGPDAVQTGNLSEDTIRKLADFFVFQAGARDEIKKGVAIKAYSELRDRITKDETVTIRLLYTEADNATRYIDSIQYKRGEKIESIKNRYCPNRTCRYRLPKVAGMYKQIIIGMLGSTQTGKTSFMASMAYHIVENNRQMLANSGLNIRALPDDIYWQLFYQRHVKNKYERGCALEWTSKAIESKLRDITKKTSEQSLIETPDAANTTAVLPFYTIALTGEKGENVIKNRLISFVDIPGELMQNPGEVNSDIINKRRILSHCESFILCIEPRQLAAGAENPERYYDSSQLFEEKDKGIQKNPDVITDNVRDVLKILGEGKKTIAVMLTKSDALREFEQGGKVRTKQTMDDGDNSPEKEEKQERHKIKPFTESTISGKYHALNMRQIEDHQNRVRDYFIRVNKDLYDKLINLPGKIRFAFFAVSQYGKKPLEQNEKPDKQNEKPRAWNIGLPFFWLLACDGCLPIQHTDKTGEKAYYVSKDNEEFLGDILGETGTSRNANHENIIRLIEKSLRLKPINIMKREG